MRRLFSIFLCCTLLACTSSSSDPSDAATSIDADQTVIDSTPVIDADPNAPDADPNLSSPPLPGEMGGRCVDNADCTSIAGGACHLDAWGTPQGMCTIFCTTDPNDTTCPTGTTCGCSGNSCACFVDCTADSECRQGDGYDCHCPGQGCMPAGWTC